MSTLLASNETDNINGTIASVKEKNVNEMVDVNILFIKIKGFC